MIYKKYNYDNGIYRILYTFIVSKYNLLCTIIVLIYIYLHIVYIACMYICLNSSFTLVCLL